MTTNKGDDYYGYLFDPESASLSELGPLPDDTADLAISARRGRILHPGRARRRPGTRIPLMEIDRSGSIRTIVELGLLIEAAGALPRWHVLVQCRSAQSRRHLRPRQRGAPGSDEGFGQPMMIVVHLPESERR